VLHHFRPDETDPKTKTHLMAIKSQLQPTEVEKLLLMKDLAEKCFLIFGFLVSGVSLFSSYLLLYKNGKTRIGKTK